MTIKIMSLTIPFFEEDQDLWEVIQSYPLDQQASAIKKVLAQYLVEKQESPTPQSNLEPLNNADKLMAQSEWNLEALFINSKSEAKIDQEGTKNSNQSEILENKITINTNPLHHLFEIIGEEEDEDVLQYLKATNHQSATLMDRVSEQRLENLNRNTDRNSADSTGSNGSPREDRFELVRQNENTCNNGLNFLLKHVIGEEEDEEVLQFFDSASK